MRISQTLRTRLEAVSAESVHRATRTAALVWGFALLTACGATSQAGTKDTNQPRPLAQPTGLCPTDLQATRAILTHEAHEVTLLFRTEPTQLPDLAERVALLSDALTEPHSIPTGEGGKEMKGHEPLPKAIIKRRGDGYAMSFVLEPAADASWVAAQIEDHMGHWRRHECPVLRGRRISDDVLEDTERVYR